MILAAASLGLLLVPQGAANAPVARFQLGGAQAYVTSDDLALELARRYHRTQRGQQDVRQLVDLYLVRREAEAKGLMPTPEQVREFAREVEMQVSAAGQDFQEFLAGRNMTRSQFEEEYVSLGLAHQYLVMDALGMDSPDGVRRDLLDLWMRQARDKIGVVEDPAQLPEGYAAKVGERYLPLLDLGRLMAKAASPEERLRFIRQIVVLRCLNAEAKARSIEVTEEEARAEVQARKQAADRDALYGGLPFEQVLLSQGLTMETLVHWPVLRAQIIESKLVDLEHTEEDLRRMLDENREDILKRHGPRRLLGILFIRATDTPNEILPRDFAAASAHLTGILEEIRSGSLTFASAVRLHSEDPATKSRGGSVGWHNGASQGLPPELIEAGFALSRGDVSDPVRGADGYYLVRATNIEPTPHDGLLIEKLHTDLQTQLRQRILEQAQVELVGASER